MTLELTSQGLYCPEGNFHIDPWEPVPRAVITHAHADHARPGCGRYLVAAAGLTLLRCRLPEASIDSIPYGRPMTMGNVQLSLHPAGHILGSAQVRMERRGHVSVVSGDYKLQSDPTCAGFEPITCHLFVTESTFGLPLFRWPDPGEVIQSLHDWWEHNRAQGTTSVVFAYALGKAQRLLAQLGSGPGPVYTHGAVERLCQVYRGQGIDLPATTLATNAVRGTRFAEGLIVAPPSAQGTPWLRRFGRTSTAIVSGWMRIRGIRRRRAVDRGFVVSDHADFSGLVATIRETAAEQVRVTHGYAGPLARWLREQGLDAWPLETPYQGERLDEPAEEDEVFAAEPQPTESTRGRDVSDGSPEDTLLGNTPSLNIQDQTADRPTDPPARPKTESQRPGTGHPGLGESDWEDQP